MNFTSRLFAQYAIRIDQGSARCIKGKTADRIMRDLSSLAAEHSLKEGEIWIDPVGRVSFSKAIPEMMHQRIRNVIFSH
jgi:hypothetical protein